jgi:hypothetical protein
MIVGEGEKRRGQKSRAKGREGKIKERSSCVSKSSGRSSSSYWYNLLPFCDRILENCTVTGSKRGREKEREKRLVFLQKCLTPQVIKTERGYPTIPFPFFPLYLML